MDYSKNFFESVERRNAEFNNLLYGAEYLKGLQVNNLMRVVTKLDFKFLADAVRLKLRIYFCVTRKVKEIPKGEKKSK